jgi:hypothetical protein
MKKTLAIVSTTAALLLAIGCTTTTLGPSEANPQLPPASSMAIPQMGSQGMAKQSAVESNNAFAIAYYAVSYWTLNVRLALLEPATLFVLAHNAEPKPLDDNSGWQWLISNGQFSATLVGRVSGDSVRWSMTVNGGSLQDFTWYTGTSTITGKNGSWTFYDTSLVNGEHPATIRFDYSVGSPTESVKVSVVNPADTSYGCYLLWTAAGSEKTFEAFDAKKPETILIGWNDVTEAGYLQNVTTGEKACWGSKETGHADIVCAN